MDVFAQRLKEARDRRKLSQVDLARQSGLPSTTISHFESGSRKPSFDNLRKLNEALGVSADYLLGATEHSAPSALANRIARHLANATEAEISMLEMFAKSLRGNTKQGPKK